MVEGEADLCTEEEMIEAIKIAHEAIIVQVNAQKEFGIAVGKTEKRVYNHETHDEELRERMNKELYDKVYAVCLEGNNKKEVRKEKFGAILDEFIASLSEEELAAKKQFIKPYFGDIQYYASRNMVLDERTRLDGRKLDEIRQIVCEVDFLPSAHGAALFTRGETQSLTTATLGTKLDEMIVDQVMLSGYSKFFLHYNFQVFQLVKSSLIVELVAVKLVTEI